MDSYDLLESEGTKSAICFPIAASLFFETKEAENNPNIQSFYTEPSIPQAWEYKNGQLKFKSIINHDEAGVDVLFAFGTSDALQMNVDGFIAVLSSPTIVDLGLLGSADFHEIKMADYIAEVILDLAEAYYKPVPLRISYAKDSKDIPQFEFLNIDKNSYTVIIDGYHAHLNRQYGSYETFIKVGQPTVSTDTFLIKFTVQRESTRPETPFIVIN